MGNLFGKEKQKKKSQVTDIDRAVLGLKKQRDQLRKTQLQIEVFFCTHTYITFSIRPQRNARKNAFANFSKLAIRRRR